MTDLHLLSAMGVSAQFDPVCGMIRDLTIHDHGRRIAPMHRAPWAGEPMPPDAPPHLTRLEGDFFCAPFSDGGGQNDMLHGWPANGRWTLETRNEMSLSALLPHSVQGARIEKHLHLCDGHPFLYQRHVLRGGSGTLSVANHAMVSLPDGGRLSLSPKSAFRTPGTAPEPDPARGRSRLAYPASSTEARDFPAADGDRVDLTRYPFGPAHEDFVVAIEAPGNRLGWTAVVRVGHGAVFLSLRDADVLPMTMLWHSNGGRDYAPWSGRHRGCLGVEEGNAPHILGQSGGLQLTGAGTLDIRHITGAIAWPTDAPVTAVMSQGDSLRIEGADGTVRDVPCALSHLFDTPAIPAP